jgi:hypothetical protein
MGSDALYRGRRAIAELEILDWDVRAQGSGRSSLQQKSLVFLQSWPSRVFVPNQFRRKLSAD